MTNNLSRVRIPLSAKETNSSTVLARYSNVVAFATAKFADIIYLHGVDESNIIIQITYIIYLNLKCFNYIVMTVIFGWIAGGIGVCYNIPQIYYTYKSKDVSSISKYSLLFRVISGILYIIHGYNIGDTAGYCMTTISTSQTLTMLIQYCIYSDSKQIGGSSVLPIIIENECYSDT